MKTGLVSFYDVDNLAVRILHKILKNAEVDVFSLFMKKERPGNFEGNIDEKEIKSFIEFVKKENFEIVGFSVRSQSYPIAKKISQRLKKEFPKILILWGGVHPTISPESCIDYCDILCIGEAEKIIVDICTGKNLRNIENIHYKKNGKIFKNSNYCNVEENLDNIPFPDNSSENKILFEKRDVIALKKDFKKTHYYIISSRGCPFLCTYCCNNSLRRIYKGKYVRRRSVENVILELKEAKEIYPNLSHISIWDDVFSFDKNWISEFSRRYKKEINLPFSCMVHPKFCNKEIIKNLKKAGLVSVMMGVQTFSKRLRKLYKRIETDEDIVQSLKLLKDYKITVSVDLIQRNPIENEEDMKENLEFLLKVKPSFKIARYNLTYFPNTELTCEFLKKEIISEEDLEHNKTTGNYNRGDILTEQNKGIADFYNSLYYLASRPWRIKKIIKKIQRNNYLRENPEKLRKILRFFAFDYFYFDRNKTRDRFKLFIKKAIFSIRKKGLRYIFIKLRRG